MLFLSVSAQAAPSNQTLSFSARLKSSTGGVVPDGMYNIGFRLYAQGSGGSPVWSETYHDANGTTDGQDNRVKVVNGYFNVKLGSLQNFENVDWTGDLWITMNIGGRSQIADISSIAWDGEMSPRIQLSAVPYAMNANRLGGKTADEFFQIGSGTKTDTSDGTSIAINKTGAGNFVNLQSSGVDAFTLSNTGSITMGSSTNQSLTVARSTSGDGKNLTLAAGGAATGSNLAGGNIVLQGGAGDGTGTGGGVVVAANGSDSTNTFQVQDAAGEAVLSVDTANKIVSVGSLKLAQGSDSGMGQNTYSLWENGTITGGAITDEGPLNLGLTFKSSTAGYVSGIKFYNPAGGNSSGNDVGKLWACNDASCNLGSGGTELASLSFPSDTSEGWKTASFSNPVSILPNTYYVVTYYTATGWYHGGKMYFDNQDRVNGPLSAMRNSVTENGSFAVGSAKFPTNTYERTNYWVDLVFQPATDIDQIRSDKGLDISSGGPMTIGTTGSSKLSLQGSSVDINSDSTTINGKTLVRAGSDTNDTFKVQDSNGNDLLSVDSLSNQVKVGSGGNEGTTLVLGSKSTSGDPSGTNGAMYYNANAGKFRCFEAGAWKDCVTPLPVYVANENPTTFLGPTDVEDLKFDLAANTKYYYKFVIKHEAIFETENAGFGVTTPTGSTGTNWCVNTVISENASYESSQSSSAYCGTGDASTTVDGGEVTGFEFVSTMEGYTETANIAGALQLRVKSQGFSGGNVMPGSFGILQIVQ